MASESRTTVYYAMAANLLIAGAKLIGGIISGSSAMLAEAAHSTADTMNQVFMLVSLTLGKRPADEEHPFGYGKERFFWTFLAAVGLFISGAAFSIGEGVRELMAGGQRGTGGYWIAYIILGVAFISEGISWLRAQRQTRRQAREAELPYFRFVRLSKDPTVKMVLSEDSAALVGVAIAAVGILLHELTGDYRWDAGASILIGVLLVGVAIALGQDTKGLLLGEAALPAQRERIRAVVTETPGVAEVIELLTMAMGPESLLVTVRVHLDADLTADQIETLACDIEWRLREAVPGIQQVFVDPTSRRELDGRSG